MIEINEMCPENEIYHLKCGIIRTRKEHKCNWCETMLIKGSWVQACTIKIPYTEEIETRYYCRKCLIEMELPQRVKKIDQMRSFERVDPVKQ